MKRWLHSPKTNLAPKGIMVKICETVVLYVVLSCTKGFQYLGAIFVFRCELVVVKR